MRHCKKCLLTFSLKYKIWRYWIVAWSHRNVCFVLIFGVPEIFQKSCYVQYLHNFTWYGLQVDTFIHTTSVTFFSIRLLPSPPSSHFQQNYFPITSPCLHPHPDFPQILPSPDSSTKLDCDEVALFWVKYHYAWSGCRLLAVPISAQIQ